MTSSFGDVRRADELASQDPLPIERIHLTDGHKQLARLKNQLGAQWKPKLRRAILTGQRLAYLRVIDQEMKRRGTARKAIAKQLRIRPENIGRALEGYQGMSGAAFSLICRLVPLPAGEPTLKDESRWMYRYVIRWIKLCLSPDDDRTMTLTRGDLTFLRFAHAKSQSAEAVEMFSTVPSEIKDAFENINEDMFSRLIETHGPAYRTLATLIYDHQI